MRSEYPGDESKIIQFYELLEFLEFDPFSMHIYMILLSVGCLSYLSARRHSIGQESCACPRCTKLSYRISLIGGSTSSSLSPPCRGPTSTFLHVNPPRSPPIFNILPLRTLPICRDHINRSHIHALAVCESSDDSMGYDGMRKVIRAASPRCRHS